MAHRETQTYSHSLAKADVLAVTAAAPSDDGSVLDLGWNQKPEHDAKPWIKGMHNEDVWVLVRRLNKEVYELKKTDHVPYGGLDLVVARDSECSPNKLRSEVERLYMGMLLGLFALVKTLARLRSWREPARTAAFGLTYFAAWTLDCLMPLLIVATIALVVSPRVRVVLFPPAPLSMVDMTTGGVAKPMAGTLGSTDAATGAPQNLKGEAVENEASNFVTSVAAIATNLMMGQDPHGAPFEQEGGSRDGFKPQFDVTTMAVVKDKAEGMDRPSQDKTKAPMEEVVWHQMTPLLHLLILTSDTWERLANILVPTPPFDRQNHRIRLAWYLVPLAALSLLVTRDVAVRALTFVVGVLLFGEPLVSRALRNLAGNGWTNYFHLNNTIFRGVPTDLQLALTLLRLGEAHRAPFPPPARVHQPPPDEPIDINETVIDASAGDQPLGVSADELQHTADHDAAQADHAGGEDTEVEQAVGHGNKREKVFNIFKGSAKEAVKAAAVVDKIRAKTGATHAKQRVGVLPPDKKEKEEKRGSHIVGPVEFSARYEGTAGYVYVNSAADEPFLAFNKYSIRTPISKKEDLKTLWVVNIEDIEQLRKHSGYGMKAKLAAGWATDGPVYDALRIVDKKGAVYIVTSLPYRDALFNRLCAIGKHAKWEVW
ncbi:hypothetical protein HYQ45_003653 [Verticillium longisporum]|uniref:Uncharacterized protein n=1 Tax=Verticillium longisporum TaxID=100787 RepID=A0A8I2ZVZ7_VERLO|nr:hypothetical protein HYQ45_003653 [Verticillium longisporum]